MPHSLSALTAGVGVLVVVVGVGIVVGIVGSSMVAVAVAVGCRSWSKRDTSVGSGTSSMTLEFGEFVEIEPDRSDCSASSSSRR
jgi:hypothetical protein